MKQKSMFLTAFCDAFLQLRTASVTLGIVYSFMALILLIIERSLFDVSYTVYCFSAPFIVIPTFTLIAFNFLFKRNGSDFFHSLPVKRSTLFFAKTFAIFCRMLLLSFCLYFFIGGFTTSIEGMFKYNVHLFFCTFASCLYTYGICAISMFLTGLTLPAILNMLVFLFTPHVLMCIYYFSLSNRLPVLNIQTPTLIDMLVLASKLRNYWLYLVLGIVFFIISLVLFVYRKSETAKQSAPNNLLKIIYCTLSSFLLCLYPIYTIFINTFRPLSIIFYGLSLVLCITYSVLSKKGKNAFKNTLFSIIAIVLLNVIFFGAVYTSSFYYKNKDLDITGFQIMRFNSSKTRTLELWGKNTTKEYNDDLVTNYLPGNNELNGEILYDSSPSVSYYHSSYAYYQTLDYFITDKDACDLLQKIYTEVAKSGANTWRVRTITNWDGSTSSFNKNVTPVPVIIKNSLGQTRCLYLPILEEEFNQLTASISDSNSEFSKLLAITPNPEIVSSFTATHRDAANSYSFGDEIYQIFYEEIQSLSVEERLSLILKAPHVINENLSQLTYVYTLNVCGTYNKNNFVSTYILDKNLLPKTCAAILEKIKKSNNEAYLEFKSLFANVDLYDLNAFTIKVYEAPSLTTDLNNDQYIRVFNRKNGCVLSYKLKDNTVFVERTNVFVKASFANNFKNTLIDIAEPKENFNYFVYFYIETADSIPKNNTFGCYLTNEDLNNLVNGVDYR